MSVCVDYHRRGYLLGKYRDDNPKKPQKGPKKTPTVGEKKRNYNLNVPVVCKGIAKRRNKELKTNLGRYL